MLKFFHYDAISPKINYSTRKSMFPDRETLENVSRLFIMRPSNNVTIIHPDEGSMGKYSPEYQLSSRVAMSQLKEPRVMKVDMRSEY